jgi:hypothetical protein
MRYLSISHCPVANLATLFYALGAYRYGSRQGKAMRREFRNALTVGF